MAFREITTPGIWPGPALLLSALLAGCGGAGSGQEQAAVEGGSSREAASMQSAALPPVERPVAKPMDRGAERPTSIHPVERPVAKPLDRPPADDEAQPDRS
jgi:hypothetical protein